MPKLLGVMGISHELANAQKQLEAIRAEFGVAYRPPAAVDLSWLAELAEPRPTAELAEPPALSPSPKKTAAPARPARPATSSAVGSADVIRITPDIHTAAHKLKQDKAARLYLVVRTLDRPGSGSVPVAAIRERLEGGGILTWDSIRKTLAAGAGVFWDRVDGKAGDTIRPRRPARILEALGGVRPSLRPVDVPVDCLFGSIDEYRAVCIYGGFLAGRRKPNDPISQAAIREATGLSERAQRRYCKIAGVTAVRTYRLEPVADDPQAALWKASRGQRGRAAYLHIDRRGLLGAPGAEYVAISSPNCYSGGSAVRGRPGRFSKTRKELPSFVTLVRGKRIQRIYFENGTAAWKAYGKLARPVSYPLKVKGRPDTALPVFWAAVPGGN